MNLARGTRLGPYEVIAALGAGGMGQVYRATDTRLRRDVAIKFVAERWQDKPDLRSLFLIEAEAIAALNHPNICQIYDVGTHGDNHFIVMEVVDGETLAARLTRGPLPIEQACRVAAEIAGALGAAHRAGIVHRDIKPANVILSRDGAKLLDFGLAQLVRPAEDPPRWSRRWDPAIWTCPSRRRARGTTCRPNRLAAKPPMPAAMSSHSAH
jgi:serine/threonine protein kinase